jgi:hypothetical protein
MLRWWIAMGNLTLAQVNVIFKVTPPHHYVITIKTSVALALSEQASTESGTLESHPPPRYQAEMNPPNRRP